ncbi:Serine/Threonine protein kinase [Orpheovirus IHUMI-LCC2]|uniref:Serine/Threonine protein kinase n=1 Tax=Orpheovirus IHUMI-LCC2 TaxID=2023057 RepID=A0A2I2L5G9_9VIRU|nr:Serine/Threonine protein kinase [Orpheovirus IHUMI-LCC2]SNW62783.1 Serine/Threonine protein kinase [Orpheovirus IHUMI-LCC2]
MENYELLELLGQGSFSKVHKCKYIGKLMNNEDFYAIKIMFAESNNVKWDNVEKEYNILKDLSENDIHNLIPRVYDLFVGNMDDKEVYCIVMEYIEGPTFAQLYDDMRNMLSMERCKSSYNFITDYLGGVENNDDGEIGGDIENKRADGDDYIGNENIGEDDIEKRTDGFNYKFLFMSLIQLLNILSYIHKNNYFHGDIKLENIIYERKKKRVILVDYGLSSRTIKGDKYQTCRHVGTCIYISKAYMEMSLKSLIEKDKLYILHWQDVWALGICFWQLINLKVPYISKTVEYVKMEIKDSSKPEPLPEINQVNKIVNLMLQKSLKDRPTANYLLHLI